MGGARVRLVASVLPASAVTAGCGSASPAAHPRRPPADSAAVQVIRHWAAALRRGDVNGAAAYFALPSRFVNGSDASGAVPIITIHNRAEAAAINATLPCGAVLVSTVQRRRYIDALFRLTNRVGVGAGCGAGVGQLARTDFVIAGGRIVDWVRVPVAGGNPGGENIPAPGPLVPASPSTTTPVV
jgi:hypothetical protein